MKTASCRWRFLKLSNQDHNKRLIVDCNILVSAGLQSKNCLKVITYATTEAQLFVSSDIVNEYQNPTEMIYKKALCNSISLVCIVFVVVSLLSSKIRIKCV